MIRVSLKYQFSFAVALLLCAIIALISYFTFTHERSSLIHERELRGRTLVRNLATASAEAILSGNELNLFSYCTDIMENEEDARSVWVVDGNGTVIAHNDPKMVGVACTTALCRSAGGSDSIRITPLVEAGLDMHDYAMSMIVLDKHLGTVRVVLSNESITRKMAVLLRDVLRLSIAAVLLGIALTVLLVHILVRPISRLRRGAAIVGTGDFGHRIQIRSRNEIGELAQAFNGMSASLETRQRQVASLNQMARSLATTLEQDALLSKSARALSDIISPDSCAIALLQGDEVRVGASVGRVAEAWPAGTVVPIAPPRLKELLGRQEAHVVRASELLSADSGAPGTGTFGPDTAVLASPLVYEGQARGVALLVGKQERPFERYDREFAEILCSAATISLLNIELLEKTARQARMEAELRTAEAVQRTLFPQEPVRMAGIEVDGFFKSASETGGDWYGYLQDRTRGCVAVFIGDVTGHGAPAALVTAAANSFVSTLDILRQRYEGFDRLLGEGVGPLPPSLDPSHLLSILNAIILRAANRQLVMTFFAATFDISRRKVYFANAGHEMPIVLPGGDPSQPGSLATSGVRLGDRADATFDLSERDLAPGDTFIFYTDGVTECRNADDEEYGNRRFLRAIRKSAGKSPAGMRDMLVDNIFSFAGDAPLADDVTLVLAKVS